LVICLFVSSCKDDSGKEKNKYDLIKKVAWLEGTWENVSEQGNLSETWQKVNDSTYAGRGFFIKDKDTLHNESIELRQKGDIVSYNPTVQGQNNNRPVEFRMTSGTDNQLTFENAMHDYPKKIIYHKISKDSMVAEISGIQQGKSSVEKYPMKKK
jgi:hypothetical protein